MSKFQKYLQNIVNIINFEHKTNFCIKNLNGYNTDEKIVQKHKKKNEKIYKSNLGFFCIMKIKGEKDENNKKV